MLQNDPGLSQWLLLGVLQLFENFADQRKMLDKAEREARDLSGLEESMYQAMDDEFETPGIY